MDGGADLSFRDEEGRTLLHWAAVSGHEDGEGVIQRGWRGAQGVGGGLMERWRGGEVER